MKRTFDRTQLGERCLMCGKGATMSLNRPHSLKRTKRVLKPNLQSFYGVSVCTRCLRSMKNDEAREKQKTAA